MPTMCLKERHLSVPSVRLARHAQWSHWALAVACLTAALAGCYSPNQKAFEKEVHTLVQPGMPVSAAVAQLTQRGFNCTGEPITCSRIRQRLLPSSCVERVNLEATGQSSSALLSVEIRPIVCAGL